MCEKSIICEIKDAILGSKINFITIINKIKEISFCKEKNYWESVQKGCVKIEEIDEKNIEEILSGLIYGLKNGKKQKKELEIFSKDIFSKWYGDKKFLKNIKENIQDEKNKGIKDKLKELDILVFGEKNINQKSETDNSKKFNELFPFLLEKNEFESESEEKKEAYKFNFFKLKFIKEKYPSLIDIYSFNHKTIFILAQICAKKEDKKEVEIKHLARICNLIYVNKEPSYNNLQLDEITKLIKELNIDKYPLNENDKIEIDYLPVDDISFNKDVKDLLEIIDKLFNPLFLIKDGKLFLTKDEIQFLTFEKGGNKSFLDVLKEKELKEKELRKKQIDEFKRDDLINKGFTPLSLVAKAEAIERIKNPKNSIEKILIEDLKNAYRYVKFLDEDVSKKFGIQDMMTNYMKIEIERLLDAKLYKKLDYSEDVREKIKTIQDKKDEKLFEINFQE